MPSICVTLRGDFAAFLEDESKKGGLGKPLVSHKSELKKMVRDEIKFECLTKRNFSIFFLSTGETYVVGSKKRKCLGEIIELIRSSDEVQISELIEVSESKISETTTFVITMIAWVFGSIWGKASESINLPLRIWLVVSILAALLVPVAFLNEKIYIWARCKSNRIKIQV
jgi:VIT1/CCC1 family predicted Fe2+/Mn2+ transporter